MRGVELAEIRDAIARAFNPRAFDMFLFDKLEFERALSIADGPFLNVVSDVLKQFEQEGKTAALIAEVAAARPMRTDLQDIYRKYARALVHDSRQQALDANIANEYARFGLSLPVTVQGSGAEKLASGDGAVEKIIQPLLHFQDAAQWREKMMLREGRVARVEIDGMPMGTAFLVGPDTALTNYHVVQEVLTGAAAPSAVRLRFDYKRLPNIEVSAGMLVGLAADWCVDYSLLTQGEGVGKPDAALPTPDELDYALLRLDSAVGAAPIEPAAPGSRPRGWIELPEAEPALHVAMALQILQHPRGAPLLLALDTNSVLQINSNGTRVRYRTNTEAGSSGSPCFNLDWQLVALHHYGDPGFKHPPYNQGIPIMNIRARLKCEGKLAALGGRSP
jgi:hypothetical protein